MELPFTCFLCTVLPPLTQHEDSKCSWCARFKIQSHFNISCPKTIFNSGQSISIISISFPMRLDMKYYIRILSGHYMISCIFFYFSIIHYSLINVDKLDLKTATHSLLVKPNIFDNWYLQFLTMNNRKHMPSPPFPVVFTIVSLVVTLAATLAILIPSKLPPAPQGSRPNNKSCQLQRGRTGCVIGVSVWVYSVF